MLDRGLLFAQAGLCVALRGHGALLFDIMAASQLRHQAGLCLHCAGAVRKGRWSSWQWYLTTKYAQAFEDGPTVRLAFEAAQRLVHPNNAEKGDNLFCHDCISLDKFRDEAAVLLYFQEKAELTRRQRQQGEQEELAVQAEAPAVAEDMELRLQRMEQMITDLQDEVARLQGASAVAVDI